MELLIPGLILVALMIYASTRIKKTAAEAFDAETIETDEFIVRKAEGFLTVIGGDSKYLFEAYSKEFGTGAAEEIRQGTAKLSVRKERSVEEAAQAIIADSSAVRSDLSEIIGERRYRVIELDKVKGDVPLRVFHKLADHGEKVYDFEIVILPETTDGFIRNIETMLNGFEVK